MTEAAANTSSGETALQSVPCALCGADDFRVLYEARDKMLGHPAPGCYVVRCRRCGLVYLNPRPPLSAKAAFYGDSYAFDEKNPAVEIEHYRPVIEYLSRLKSGRVLDVGTGNSSFLTVMRDRGWEVAGTEVDESLVEYFRNRHGIELFLGQLEDAGYPAGSFDAVTMFGVLEHVPDPASLLGEVSRILKDDGVFCLWSFNRDIEARMLGRYWPGFDPPRHFYSFSRETLTRLLDRAGFQVEPVIYPRISYLPYSAVWAAKRAKGLMIGGGQPAYVLTLPRWLDLLSRPLARILSASGRSSNLYIFARKKRQPR